MPSSRNNEIVGVSTYTISGYPQPGPLYIKMTESRVDGAATLAGARDIFGALSISSQFKVCLHLITGGVGDVLSKYLYDVNLTKDPAQNEYYNFYCAEAFLPGATFDLIEESGSHQGIIEKFPTKRIYPEFTATFYVDNDYRLIRLFEEWMNYINPIHTSSGVLPGSPSGQGNAKSSRDFFRLRYPDSYRRIISIVKFERNFIKYDYDNPTAAGQLGNVPSMTYRMIDAFPTNITAIPVSYEGSTITKTTITFNYSRYVIEKNDGTGTGDFKNSSNSIGRQ